MDNNYLKATYEKISDAILPPQSPSGKTSPTTTDKRCSIPSSLRQAKGSMKAASSGSQPKDATSFPLPTNPSPVTKSPSTRTRSKKIAKRSPRKRSTNRKSRITAKKKLAYTMKGPTSPLDLLSFYDHTGFTSEERSILRKHNTLGYGDLEKYGWKYAETDTFDRRTNSKLRTFLINKLGLQNEHGKSYSEVFHFDYVEESVGADFYDDVFSLIQQTNVLLGAQDPDLLSDQENKYRRVNPGGDKKLGNTINPMQGLESDFYTLIITFSEIEVVLDQLDSEIYDLPSPVYLRVYSKRMFLIKHNVFFWYPANNTQNARRWVEFKIMANTQNGQNQEKVTDV